MYFLKFMMLVPIMLLAQIEASADEWLAVFDIKSSFSELKDHDEATGIYEVEFSEIDDVISGSLSGLPAGKIALYASVADSLPEVLGEIKAPFENLKEIPIELDDSNDNGVFDQGDKLLFFGTSMNRWRKLNSEDQKSADLYRYHTYSPFTSSRKYYLGLKKANGLRISKTLDFGVGSEVGDVRTYKRIEKDSVLLDLYFLKIGISEFESGREWSWKTSDKSSPKLYSNKDFNTNTFDFSGIKDSAFIQIEYQGARNRHGGDRSFLAADLDIRLSHIDGDLTWDQNNEGFAQGCQLGGCFWSLGQANLQNTEWGYQEKDVSLINNERQLEGLTFSWLDDRDDVQDAWFFLDDVLGVASVSNTSNKLVRVVDGYPTHVISKGQSVSDSLYGQDVAYFSVVKNEGLKPSILNVSEQISGTIKNLLTGDVSSGSSSDLEYLIITPDLLKTKALDLKEYRSKNTHDPIVTGVVLAEDIYRVMGSNFDPAAIRDYIAYAKSTFAPKLKYILMYGDGHFDYRGIKHTSTPNLLPPFEDNDMMSDDYYASIEIGQVMFEEGMAQTGRFPQLAIGRLPIRNESQADLYLSKVKMYEEQNQADFGPWRNRVLFLADDFQQLSENDGIDHARSVNATYETIANLRPDVESPRIYLLDYEIDLSFKKPAARQDLIRSLNKGVAFTSYFGHGGISKISDENLFDVPAISQLINDDKLTVFAAFSCTVGKWDAASVVPLSQEFLVSNKAGAIATISATRESYANSNEALAVSFYSELYGANDDIRLGEAFRLAKEGLALESSKRLNSQRYNLLGEPVLKWKVPQKEIKFETIPDTLQALDKIKLEGMVEGLTSGQLYLVLKEQNISRTWKDTISGTPRNTSAIVAGRVIYSETIDVVEGRFDTEFISPRKLSFGDTNAVIQAYAWRDGSDEYGSFYKSGIPIYGTSSYADSIVDSSPPEINFFSCSDNGNVQPLASSATLSLPLCVQVEVFDSTGLDYVENPDEGISFQIEGINPPEHPLFSEQSGKRAVFRVFLDEDTPLGKYSLRVSARDILEQATNAEIELDIQGVLKAGLMGVYNKPNPMRNNTTFHFQLGSSGMEKATVRIFSQSGKLLKVLDNVVPGQTTWNGRDQWGNLLANGLYYYRVITEHRHIDSWDQSESKASFSKLQKLVISR